MCLWRIVCRNLTNSNCLLILPQVNPARAPEVVGALLDAEAPDEFVNNLILSVRSLIPVERLCAEVEQRNRLKLLSPFLEHLVSEGSQVGAAAVRWAVTPANAASGPPAFVH